MYKEGMFVFWKGSFSFIFLNKLPVFFQDTFKVGGGGSEGLRVQF